MELVESDVPLAFRRRRLRADRRGAATAGGAALAAWVLVQRSALGAAAGAAALGAWLVRRGERTAHAEHVVTIARSPDEVFAYLDAVERWPEFSARLVEVLRTERGLRWLERVAPRVTRWWDVVELDARRPDHVAWRATSRGLTELGAIHLVPAPGGRGTEVREVVEHRSRWPLARQAGAVIGWAPRQVLRADLRRLKRRLEAGEVGTWPDAPAGRRDPLARVLLRTGALP